jgi:KaiC/GvpD/RAD55 family RecA-like ATPase
MSILALEFFYRGAVADQPGIFVAFEERGEALRRRVRTPEKAVVTGSLFLSASSGKHARIHLSAIWQVVLLFF